MKRGTEYAKRIKQLHHRMLKKLGKPKLPEPTDPIQQLVIGILAENGSEAKAAALFKRICGQMVDLNELRVTPAIELAEMFGSTVPQAREKAERIVHVLNEIRLRQDSLDLSFLKQRGRREAREYLESLDGVGPYASASVIVYSLGGHAVPVDFLTIYVLRKQAAIDDAADVATVQGFLERHVHAAHGRPFAILLNRYVSGEGARVQVSRLPALLNLAPPAAPKPLRKSSMEKPAPPPSKNEVVGLTGLEGVKKDEAVLAPGNIESKVVPGPTRKPIASNDKNAKKHAVAAAAPANRNLKTTVRKPKSKPNRPAVKKER